MKFDFKQFMKANGPCGFFANPSHAHTAAEVAQYLYDEAEEKKKLVRQIRKIIRLEKKGKI